jgi:hypothetical protein
VSDGVGGVQWVLSCLVGVSYSTFVCIQCRLLIVGKFAHNYGAQIRAACLPALDQSLSFLHADNSHYFYQAN